MYFSPTHSILFFITVGRDANLPCVVEHLGTYKVSVMSAEKNLKQIYGWIGLWTIFNFESSRNRLILHFPTSLCVTNWLKRWEIYGLFDGEEVNKGLRGRRYLLSHKFSYAMIPKQATMETLKFCIFCATWTNPTVTWTLTRRIFLVWFIYWSEPSRPPNIKFYGQLFPTARFIL